MKINHQLFNWFIDVVVPVDRGGNLQMGGGTRFYLHPGGKPQVINGIEVQRISHCDLQYLFINLKGDSEVLLGKVLIDALYCLGVYGGGREIYKLYFELKGKGLGDIDVGGILLLYQDGADPDVFLLPASSRASWSCSSVMRPDSTRSSPNFFTAISPPVMCCYYIQE
jgi:hypothetical protein